MKKYIILFPLYNDWTSLWKLCKDINYQIKDLSAKFSFLFVNDASSEKKPRLESSLTKIDSIKIINMKKNQLSGRCIATGLKYLSKNEDFDHVIVMDSDGEDKPEHIINLFNKSSEFPNKTIVANRHRRGENFFYKLMYIIHKAITLFFTGKLIKFGNFVCLPKNHVNELLSHGCLWNSFSAAIAKIIEDKTSIEVDRGKRYYGPSKTSYLRLIHHSFTITSVFIKRVFFRVLLITTIYFILIYDQISILSFIPLIILLFFLSINLIISRRGSLIALQNSLQNIENIDTLK